MLLPVSLLHLLIQFSPNQLYEFFDKYLDVVLRNYLASKAAFDDQFKRWLDLSMGMTKATRNTFRHMNPFEPFLRPEADENDQNDENER